MSGMISSENINTLSNGDINNIISYHKDISNLINNSPKGSLTDSTSLFFRRFTHGIKVMCHRFSNRIFHNYPGATKEPVWINNSKITNILKSELKEIATLKDKDTPVIRKITAVVQATLDCRDLTSLSFIEMGPMSAPVADPESSLKDPIPDLETIIPPLKIRRYTEDYSQFKKESEEQILPLEELINRIKGEISDIEDLSSRCSSSPKNEAPLEKVIHRKNALRKHVLQEKLKNAQTFLSKKKLIAKVMELTDLATQIKSNRGDESYLKKSLGQILSSIGMENWSHDNFTLKDSIMELGAKFFALKPADPLPIIQMEKILALLNKGLNEQNKIPVFENNASTEMSPAQKSYEEFLTMYNSVSDAVTKPNQKN